MFNQYLQEFSLKNKAMSLVIISFFIILSFTNYLLFHSLIELFNIIIAFNIFIIATNTYEVSQNNYLTFIGIAYGFIGIFDLLHTLSYKGMGVFSGFDANLPTQLWIIGRYMESFTLLLSYRFLSRKINKNKVIFIYVIISLLLLISIFKWGVFPFCYSESVGLTSFKIYSEYIISGILLTTIFMIKKYKDDMNHDTYTFIFLSLAATIISEIFFTFYIEVYGLSNMFGHIFKLSSFYFIYKAIIETSFKKPYETLFFELDNLNKQLEMEKNKLKKYLDISDIIFLVLNPNGEIISINKKGYEFLGYNEDEVIGVDWFDDHLIGDELKEHFLNVMERKNELVENHENVILTKHGEEKLIAWHNTVLKDEEGNIEGVLSAGLDITKHVLLKGELEYNKLKIEFFAILTHELKTPLNLMFSSLLNTATEMYHSRHVFYQ